MKKNEIPPTRACEGLGLPSPRDFLDPQSLVLEVYIPNFRGRLTMSSQVQGKVKARLRQDQDRVRVRSRQG